MSKVQHPTKHYLVHVVKEYGKDFELLFVYLLLNYCYIHLNTMPISRFHLGFWLRLRHAHFGFWPELLLSVCRFYGYGSF